jgi:hypothetical protein
MTNYLTLHTTDGSSSGENVDPVAALNNNYDVIDTGLHGYQSFNSYQAVVNLANPEIGQEIVPAFDDGSGFVYSDGAYFGPGGSLWVADNTNTWREGNFKEVWGAWNSLQNTSGVGFGNHLQYRTSNLGRVEWDGYLTGAFPSNGTWLTIHDPNLATPKIPYAGNGPIVLGGAIYFQQGCTDYGGSTIGDQITWAFDSVNIASTLYLRVRAAYTEVVVSAGTTNYINNITYDAGYAGVV